MTIFHDMSPRANIARLNAFLDRFPEEIDPDFDDTAEELDRQLAECRFSINQH